MLGVGPASGGVGGTEVSAGGGVENTFVEQGVVASRLLFCGLQFLGLITNPPSVKDFLFHPAAELANLGLT